MGKLTICTILDAPVIDPEIAAALFTQCIQRAITKQAVKIFRIRPFVAGKIFAFLVTEKRVFLIFPILFFHISSHSARTAFLYKKSGVQTPIIHLLEVRRYFGVDHDSFNICGGNENIRSSIACHLILYNSYEQAHSIKNVCSKSRQHLGIADIPKLVVTLYTEA